MYELLAQDKETMGEACGIFAGDGGMYATQRSFVLEVRGDKGELPYYSDCVRPIFEKILSRKLKLIRRYYSNGYVIGIRVCGKEAAKIFHTFLEFPIGSKSNSVRIPRLVFNNHEYWKAYVRGVFDTGGSLYLRRTGKKYTNPVVEISSHSLQHLLQLKEILQQLGFNFWLEKGNFRLRLAGMKNVERFFKEISPHNNTKLEKFARIMRTKK
jgi:DNA-binding transcriptional regulator WhiA